MPCRSWWESPFRFTPADVSDDSLPFPLFLACPLKRSHLVTQQHHTTPGTDSGVHASGQVAHLDLPSSCSIPPAAFSRALNQHLRSLTCPSPSIAVLAADLAPNTFHARFSATSRSYCYRIVNRRAPLALERGKAWHVQRPLDVGRMQAAAKVLEGVHDFAAFCRSFLSFISGCACSLLNAHTNMFTVARWSGARHVSSSRHSGWIAAPS